MASILEVQLPKIMNRTAAAPSNDNAGLMWELATQHTSTLMYGILAVILLSTTQSIYKAATTSLNKIPGPWYGGLTTIHLRWFFARGTIWQYAQKNHKEYGDVIRLGPRQVWISDKKAMKEILQTTDLPKVTMYAEISRDRFSPGLFGEIRPQPHKTLKRFLGPAFTISSVDHLDNFFKECTSTLLKNYYKASNGKRFTTDMMRDFHCLALDIMGESAFGRGFGQIDQVFDPSRVQSKEEKEWSKIPDAIFSGLANRYKFVFVKRFFRRIGIPVEFDWPKEMITAISGLIDERKASEEGPEEERKDVLQHMLEEGARPDNGVRMTNRDIIDQMSELLLAGSETTSGTIGCLFLELARNPKVRAKLLASLPKFGKDDEILDSKRVREDPEFRYLEACIQENLRMHPIASEMGRRTLDQTLQAGEHTIPPYTVVSASYRVLHLDERYWPQADRFWPERWLKGDEMEGAPEPDMDAYFPFSAGKHSCIGMNFAMAEIRTVSANILTRFDIEEHCYKEIDFRQFITMQFHDGSWKADLIPRE